MLNWWRDGDRSRLHAQTLTWLDIGISWGRDACSIKQPTRGFMCIILKAEIREYPMEQSSNTQTPDKWNTNLNQMRTKWSAGHLLKLIKLDMLCWGRVGDDDILSIPVHWISQFLLKLIFDWQNFNWVINHFVKYPFTRGEEMDGWHETSRVPQLVEKFSAHPHATSSKKSDILITIDGNLAIDRFQN